MNHEPLHCGHGISAAEGLFALAGVVFGVSLLCPVVEVRHETLYGWGAAHITATGSVAVLWYLVTRQLPMAYLEIVTLFIGLFANLTLLTSALFGRKLRHRHAMPMLLLAINGLVAGLIMPATMTFGLGASAAYLETYGQLQIGYWLWIASLALVAAGWWCVVWKIKVHRRQLHRTQPWLLFAATGIVFAISMCSPVIQSTSTHVMPGFDVFLMTFQLAFFPWMRIEALGKGEYIFISVPSWLTLIAGTFANLTLIASAVAGWFLRRRAAAMCYLAACGLLAGLLTPIVGVSGGWAEGVLSDFYDALYRGYWLWIVALALHAIGWWSVVRNHRRNMRYAAIDLVRVQLRDKLPSGESMGVDVSPKMQTMIEE
jgi:hypothetical protein